MKIAHLSDLHVLSLDGVSPWRFANKRLSGYANLRLKRGHAHRAEHIVAIAREIAKSDADHVVVTGDLTNLALESEFEAVRNLIERELHLGPRDVTIVPGNHDLYTRGAMLKRRFLAYFGDYVRSDIPVPAATDTMGAFPFVRLRGPCAIIGLSSAVPRPPFVAAGEIGQTQAKALVDLLRSEQVAHLTPVLLVHHPLHNPASPLKARLEGLRDAERLVDAIAHLERGLVLHGHLHRGQHKRHETRSGHVDVVGATSASLEHELDHKMAGFNMYEVDDGGAIRSIGSKRLEPKSGQFQPVPLADHVWA